LHRGRQHCRRGCLQQPQAGTVRNSCRPCKTISIAFETGCLSIANSGGSSSITIIIIISSSTVAFRRFSLYHTF
jgi:hypothetical protein